MLKKSCFQQPKWRFIQSAAPKSPVSSIIMPLSWRIHTWLAHLNGSLICVNVRPFLPLWLGWKSYYPKVNNQKIRIPNLHGKIKQNCTANYYKFIETSGRKEKSTPNPSHLEKMYIFFFSLTSLALGFLIRQMNEVFHFRVLWSFY